MSDSRERNHAQGGMASPLRIDDLERDPASYRLGTKFHYFSEVDSTNSYARRIAQRGALEGEVVVAERQTAGRGRLDRTWISPPFSNLYCSFVLRPSLAPVEAPQITLMAAVALADTVAFFLDVPPAIKWPNDILIGGRKLAGILTESCCDTRRIEFVILGIGVNVNFHRDEMPEAIRNRATSMMESAGRKIGRQQVLRRLIQDLDRCYGILLESGFQAIAPLWEGHFGLRGRRVRVEVGAETLCGTAMGIDRDGALLVEDDLRQLRRVVAGDVIAEEE